MRLVGTQICFQFASKFVTIFALILIYSCNFFVIVSIFSFCYHICSQYISSPKYFVTINNHNFASNFVTIFALILIFYWNYNVTVSIFHFVTIFALILIYFSNLFVMYIIFHFCYHICSQLIYSCNLFVTYIIFYIFLVFLSILFPFLF